MRKRFHPAFVVIPIILILILALFWPRGQSLGEFEDAVGRYALGDTRFTIGEVGGAIFEWVAFWQDDGSQDEQRDFVVTYFDLIEEQKALDRQIERGETNHAALQRREDVVALIDANRDKVERILESQIEWAIFELGIREYTIMPPVEIQLREDPSVLIISERESINEIKRIFLIDHLTMEEKEQLEAEIDAMGYSAFVVSIGGRSTYPATIRPQGIRATLETTAHEWLHNYRSLKNPIGKVTDSESRAIEETIANLLDQAIGNIAYQRFYDPSYVPPAPTPATQEQSNDPDVFDFNSEMRETYLRTIELLEAGLIDEAEAYMDRRRDFFEENGKFERKINQAYFAFTGSYATNPAFSFGQNGIGDKLQKISNYFNDPAAFFNAIAHITNIKELDKLLAKLGLAELPPNNGTYESPDIVGAFSKDTLYQRGQDRQSDQCAYRALG